MTNKEDKGGVIWVVIILCAYLFLFKTITAGAVERLNIDADVEYKLSDFQRDPEPALASTGGNLSQNYRLYLSGGVLKEGALDGLLGASFKDKYRQDDADLENKLNFDYGSWFKIDTLSRHETDEEIFFSGSLEPQSPIDTFTKKYDAKVALNAVSSLEYIFENKQRKDLLLGTVTADENTSEILRFTADGETTNFSGEYRKNDFEDLLGARSDVLSEDLDLEMSYQPVDYFAVSAFWENGEDKDIVNNTALESKDSRLEMSLMPLKELKIHNRLSIKEDNDTKTQEDISAVSDELAVAFDPNKQMGLELAYKRIDEDKHRASNDIESETNEQRAKLRLSPLQQINMQAGYDVSDKESSASTENIKNEKAYSDFSFQPLEPIRLGANFSRALQKNTFTSLTESDTKSIAASLQYRPRQSMSLFMRLDTTKTDNPASGSFTKTDTVSSNFSIQPLPLLGLSLRTSRQETTGSSASSLSERLLNAVEINLKLIENLKISCEYELIDSRGPVSSDENLFDIAAFYNIGKLDLSLRYQERSVSGEGPTDKSTVLSNIKYRFSANAVLSFRFSLIDYADKNTPANSYDSTTAESILSMRF